MSWENLPLLIILVLAVVGQNQSVALAAAILLVVKLIGLDTWFPMLESKGLNWGITLLTIGILAPVASGKVSLRDLQQSFSSPVGITATIIGIFVAWVAGRGIVIIKETPETVTSLVLGTVVGVTFLQGVAVGPLIAAGLLSLLVSITNLFK
ncbi:putative membrane protein [Propionispora sp. 2/2-37]|uniref:DUF441 domain-containing protein n=1 Tax=Propionispora sp. 2/2-37 TaxID=1677858 RepID=UPI0006BB73C4|nr:DUF441 domain-containing protein [Propionispora sp. 2/2-37]CUH95408.1 putative membrane protein [Propionispora sp. 2/2-37]